MIAGVGATVGLGSLLAVAGASAATNTSGSDNLVSKIAAKFNLNQDEVKAVFDEDRATHEAEMRANVDEKLTQAVTDGKITEAQKTLITDKMAELKSTREANKDSFQNLTESERKAKIDEERAAIEKWATDNNIPKEFLRMAGPRGHGPGGHGPRGDASDDNATDTTTSTTSQ